MKNKNKKDNIKFNEQDLLNELARLQKRIEQMEAMENVQSKESSVDNNSNKSLEQKLDSLISSISSFEEKINTINQDLTALKNDVAQMKSVKNVDLQEKSLNKVAQNVSEIKQSLQKLDDITAESKNNSIIADNVKTIKKDVEDIREKAIKINVINRQIENIKYKIDTLYKSNSVDNDSTIMNQLKSIQTRLEDMQKSSNNKLNFTNVQFDDEQYEPDFNGEVVDNISSLKKDLNIIMDMMNDIQE